MLRFVALLGGVPAVFTAPVAPRAKNFFMIVSPCARIIRFLISSARAVLLLHAAAAWQ
jgi:hypothetical protein